MILIDSVHSRRLLASAVTMLLWLSTSMSAATLGSSSLPANGVPLDSIADTLSAPSGNVSILDTIWLDIEEAATDGLLLFSAPARFGAREWAMTGGALAGTGGMMLLDDPVRDLFARDHDSTRDRIAEFGNSLGTFYPAAGLVGSLYLGGLIFDEPSLRRAGRHVGQALLYAGLTTTTLKIIIGRARPYLNEGPSSFYGPSRGDEHWSLPSGHTTAAFAIASSLSADIDRPWATVGLYGLATLTGLSRIYVDRHWASDVFLGAIIGGVCGWGVVNLHEALDGSSSLLILPTPNGVMMTMRI